MDNGAFIKKFDLKHLQENNYPEYLFNKKLGPFPEDVRVLHYQIKNSESNILWLNKVNFLHDYINDVMDIVEHRIGLHDRYIYVTVDQGWVEPGDTQRTAGWHIDGLQGDEVPVKRAGDCQVIWSDALPTEYTTQKFDIEGLDVSKHNVFEWLAKQVSDVEIRSFAPNWAVLHSSYLVHRAAVARERTYRRFVRISFTHIPVTSKKMTVNEFMPYNYQIHTTTGEIPKELVA